MSNLLDAEPVSEYDLEKKKDNDINPSNIHSQSCNETTAYQVSDNDLYYKAVKEFKRQ